MTFGKALLRFLVCMAVGWVFMYLAPVQWFYMEFLPFSFLLLMGLVTFGVCGLGWPFAAPMGILWKPNNRIFPGILMCAVWILVALILKCFVGNVYPKMPMTPWFGIIVFGVTLWYTFDGVGPHPFKQAWANWLFATVLIMVLSIIIWLICVDLKGTPAEKAPFNPNGFFQADWWFGFCVWVIVWIQVWGFPMCFQGWPFYKLPKPLFQIILAIVCVLLGYIFWAGGLALGISPTFWFGAVAASMIGWSLMHSVAFEFAPFAKYRQPKRGVLNFILEEVVLTFVWIMVLRVILQPMLVKVQAAGLPFDINQLSAFFTLHVVAVALLIHQFFFMRAPLPIPGPPLGPDQVPGE
jgi:hypothetical protein